jgi:predicted SnoaL-like aldol condensation-catalyzing enzyme
MSVFNVVEATRSDFIKEVAAFGGMLALGVEADIHTVAGATETSAQKSGVIAMLLSVGAGASGSLDPFDAHFKQHNINLADGLEGLRGLVETLPKGADLVRPIRIFEDEDYVFTHSTLVFGEMLVGFDVYRFENGKIVEHWDNQQPMAQANASGHTMIDGPTRSTGGNTNTNKTLVRAFVDEFYVQGRTDKVAGYFDGDHFIQHSPLLADGLSSLKAAVLTAAKAGVAMRYDTIHKVLGEGDMVLVLSEGRLAGMPTAFYDLFRVENGKIAEHWDVLATIPDRSAWKNPNGKF